MTANKAILGEKGTELFSVESNGPAIPILTVYYPEVAFFVAPKILTGRNSRPVVGGDNPGTLSEALQLHSVHQRRIGTDFLITGYVEKNTER